MDAGREEVSCSVYSPPLRICLTSSQVLKKAREFFGLIETRVLSDGRDWILGSGVSLADLQGAPLAPFSPTAS